MNRQPDTLARFPAAFALVVLLMLGPVACSTVFRATVSLTQLVDGASKSYAQLYNSGLVPPDLAAKVATAHLNYRMSARTARDALMAYKTSGDPATYNQAFALAAQAATEFVTLLLPLLAPHDAISLQSGLQLAVGARAL